MEFIIKMTEKKKSSKKTVKPLFNASDNWTFKKIHEIYDEVEKIGVEEMGLNPYPNQIEIISSEQMLDAYSSIGLPILYSHWSFGKHFIRDETLYRRGQTGLAFEIIINSSPSIAYCMEENSITMMALVISHACLGHCHFFKNNYLFRAWTDAESILDYLVFAKDYIKRCEERYGSAQVEFLLDSLHAIQDYGVDRYHRPAPLSLAKEIEKQKERIEYEEKSYNDIWRTVDFAVSNKKKDKTSSQINPDIMALGGGDLLNQQFAKDELGAQKKFGLPEENILYFLEKFSPVLKPWQKEIVRIVRKISQYFYPQKQCLVGDSYVVTPNGLQQIHDVITQEGYNRKQMSILSNFNEFQETSHFYKRKVGKTVRITTKSGRVLEGTPEHPIQILKDTLNIEFEELEKLKIGDYAVTKIGYDTGLINKDLVLDFKFDEDRSTTVECKICGVHMSNICTHITMVHDCSIDQYRELHGNSLISEDILYRRSKNFEIPKIMTTDLGRLLGYFVSEGSFNKGSFNIGNKDRIVIEDIKNILNSMTVSFREIFREDGFITIEVYNQKFFDFVEYLGVKRTVSYYKEIPWSILQSNVEIIKDFLRALFEGDGTNTSTGDVMYFSRSENLVRQIQILLLHLGIVSKLLSTEMDYEYKVKVPNKTMWRLKVIRDYRDKFLSDIGFITDKKNNYCEDGKFFSKSDDNGIPFLKEYLLEIRNSLDPTQSKFKPDHLRRENIPQCRRELVSRREMEKFSKIMELLEQTDLVLHAKVRQVMDEHNFYDRIISIEILNEEKYVYDFTIPENHMFISNGFVSHNTQVMNEGCATFVHYYIMNRLFDKGLITEGSMLEFLSSHTAVIRQPKFDERGFSGFNPYALGFAMMRDIVRICEDPTPEDREWFPDMAGSGDGLAALRYAWENFRDESFIQQYLSPKVMRDFHMFALLDNSEDFIEVSKIHNSRGYDTIRKTLARSYNLSNREPDIQISDVNMTGDRTLTLKHNMYRNIPLSKTNTEEVLKHLSRLWGYPIILKSVSDAGVVKSEYRLK